MPVFPVTDGGKKSHIKLTQHKGWREETKVSLREPDLTEIHLSASRDLGEEEGWRDEME